jgi:hypothetical protein
MLFLSPEPGSSRYVPRHYLSNSSSNSLTQYLDENLGALNVHLTPEEVEEVRRIAERADATSIGARVPPGTEHLCYADSPELEE